MRDSKGIFRGVCMDCGEDECSEFEKVETTPFCGYCGCPATKHKKRKVTEECINDISTSENDASISVQHVLAQSKPEKEANLKENNPPTTKLLPIATVASVKLDSLIPDLPVFSKCVREALEKDNFQGSNLWDNCIMQTSAHYINCPHMKTSTAYGIVGRRMFEKYPSIESPGKTPWSKFVKALSRKIRKDRYAKRTLKNLQNKSFTHLQSMDVDEKEQTQNFTTGQQTTSIFLRSQTPLPPKSTSDIIDMQKKLSDEWKKQKPEKTLLKFCLKETFTDRTALLQEESSFERILASYPCLSSADYFIVEFGIMVGPTKMKEFSNKLKEFFDKVQDRLEISNKYVDPLLAAWLTFEKKVSIFQTKALKYIPIIEVTENSEDFKKKLSSVPATQSPSAIVLLKDDEIKDAAVIHAGQFLNETPRSIIGLLTVLIAVYYSLELNYPVQYVQAMGALGLFVLEHDYYKLGKKAKTILDLLK